MSRRGRGEGSITFRKDKGLWQGRIELERDPKTGKRRRRTVYANTKQKLLERLTKERTRPDAVRTGEVATAGELIDLYLVFVDNHRREATRISYRRALSMIRSSIEKLPLARLTKAKISLALAALDPVDAVHAHRILKTCLRWAVAEEYLVRSPMTGLRPPKEIEPKKVRFWTPQEAAALLKAARGHWMETMLRLLLSTGIRLGEVLGLQWGDVDFERGTLRIDRQLTENKSKQTIGPPKTEKSRRSIRLSTADLSMLFASRPEDSNGEDPIFKGQRCRRWIRRAVVRDGLDEIINAAGVPRRTVHATRHTNATALLRAGVPIKVVSERLGHSSVSITWETYAHVLPEQHEEAARATEDLFG